MPSRQEFNWWNFFPPLFLSGRLGILASPGQKPDLEPLGRFSLFGLGHLHWLKACPRNFPHVRNSASRSIDDFGEKGIMAKLSATPPPKRKRTARPRIRHPPIAAGFLVHACSLNADLRGFSWLLTGPPGRRYSTGMVRRGIQCREGEFATARKLKDSVNRRYKMAGFVLGATIVISPILTIINPSILTNYYVALLQACFALLIAPELIKNSKVIMNSLSIRVFFLCFAVCGAGGSAGQGMRVLKSFTG
jgi:hypothetical protein